ncbi:hypothetical protein [Azospirillum halopraeferens]|uniref:hypothetical protein n=1 Tax=Azospirillum halopraeferens TaxID=34010 RepID=UPI0004039DB2|nr:hypothetical protein [Azospirillum halopraeferens]
MTRPNDFAQAYLAAHAEAGLTRISVAHILHRIAAEPGYLFDPEFSRLAGQCPVRHDTRQEDPEKVVVNTTLAVLYDSLRRFIVGRLPLDAEGRLRLPPPPESPYGVHPDDTAALAGLSAEDLCAFLRDCTCHLLDALITRWAAGVLAEEESCRQAGDGITAGAAASFVLARMLETSALYTKSGYDLLSITKTGSHTALHVCWSLAEAAPLLLPGRDAAFYDALVRRSLKQVLPLSMGSLGMLVRYMEGSAIEAADHQATHVLPLHQGAFVLNDGGGEPFIRLSTAPIVPTAKPGEQHYTGCPAFYVTGMIELYMEIVLAAAAAYGVWDRLQDRTAPAAPRT